YYPGSRAAVHEESLAQARAEVEKSQAALKEAGVKLASAKQKLADFTAGKTADPAAKTPPATVFLSDNFAQAQPELWTMGERKWEYKDGRLIQSDPRDAITQLLSVKSHPADIVARFKFKTTGGDVY